VAWLPWGMSPWLLQAGEDCSVVWTRQRNSITYVTITSGNDFLGFRFLQLLCWWNVWSRGNMKLIQWHGEDKTRGRHSQTPPCMTDPFRHRASVPAGFISLRPSPGTEARRLEKERQHFPSPAGSRRLDQGRNTAWRPPRALLIGAILLSRGELPLRGAIKTSEGGALHRRREPRRAILNVADLGGAPRFGTLRPGTAFGPQAFSYLGPLPAPKTTRWA